MRIATTYFPVEQQWSWSIWLGHAALRIDTALFDYAFDAHQAAQDWLCVPREGVTCS